MTLHWQIAKKFEMRHHHRNQHRRRERNRQTNEEVPCLGFACCHHIKASQTNRPTSGEAESSKHSNCAQRLQSPFEHDDGWCNTKTDNVSERVKLNAEITLCSC